MKHEFTVLLDVNRRSGDVLISGKKGETLKLSDREAAIAATFSDELEYKGIVPENESEEEFAHQVEELPQDFPARQILIDAGYTTIAKVEEADDETLLDLNDIGDKTLAKIREYQGDK